MITLKTIRDLIATATEKYLAKYPHHTDHVGALLSDLTVEINHRCRTKAGCARWRRGILNIHGFSFKMEISSFVHKNSSDQELYETVSHELAHLLEARITGRSGHGPFWKQIHAAMGGNSERCHHLETVKKNKRKAVKLEKDGKIYYMTPRRFAACHNNVISRGYMPIALVERVPTMRPDGKYEVVDYRIGSVLDI